jgi:hypothetical protein
MLLSSLDNVNVDKDWIEIQNMLQAGIIPSTERLKEYYATCCQNNLLVQEKEKILSCLAEILRLEEERCFSTNASTREFLVVLNSG